MSAAEVVLAVVGTAALVMAIVLLTSHKSAAVPQERVIVREERPDMWRWWGMGPYYSHLPVRPLIVG